MTEKWDAIYNANGIQIMWIIIFDSLGKKNEWKSTRRATRQPVYFIMRLLFKACQHVRRGTRRDCCKIFHVHYVLYMRKYDAFLKTITQKKGRFRKVFPFPWESFLAFLVITVCLVLPVTNNACTYALLRRKEADQQRTEME